MRIEKKRQGRREGGRKTQDGKGYDQGGGTREKGDRRRGNDQAKVGRGGRVFFSASSLVALVPVVPFPASLTCAVERASFEGVIDAGVMSTDLPY